MISVIIPAYNEENAIGEVISRVQKVLTGMEYEILVINDGSTDETESRARTAGAKIIAHPHNIGYGRSLKDGIRAAQYQTIVITDADGSYPVEDIPQLLDLYQKGFDMVVGRRTGKHYQENLHKTLFRYILKWLVEFTAGSRIPDINSGLRVFSKTTVLPYLNHFCNTFSFTTSMTLAYMMTGRYVTYFPINYQERIGKTKVHLFRDSLRTLQLIVQSILFYNPIKLFLVICIFPAILAVFSFIFSLAFHLPYAFLIGLGSFLTMLVIFSLGLLADMLRQLMRSNDEQSPE